MQEFHLVHAGRKACCDFQFEQQVFKIVRNVVYYTICCFDNGECGNMVF